MRLRNLEKILYIIFIVFFVCNIFSCSKSIKNENIEGAVSSPSNIETTSEEVALKNEIVDNTINNESIAPDIPTVSFDTIKKVLDYSDSELVDNYESIKFGKYEQDNNLTNGKEDIEWVVLNKGNNRLFLISKYILDKYEYNVENKYIEWKDASLRNWLNNVFYNEAFDDEEKKAIVQHNYKNYAISVWTKEDGEIPYESLTTDDVVSLLGYNELVSYMGKPGDNEYDQFHNRRVVAKPTIFATNKQNNYYNIKLFIENRNVWQKGCAKWWLRSMYVMGRGSLTNQAANVETDGVVMFEPVECESVGVRPVIYIDISKISSDKASFMFSGVNSNNKKNNNTTSNAKVEPIITKAESESNWEMTLFNKALVDFENNFKNDRSYRSNDKQNYITEPDGSVVFTYGLRDIDKDNIKELLIYNHDKLFSIYKLANDYYESTPNYKDLFYPMEIQVIFPWGDHRREELASIYSDNYIVICYINTYTQDFSNDQWYNSLPENEKIEVYNANNLTDYMYDVKYLKDKDLETVIMFSYSTNSEDGLGEYDDFSNETRMSLAEGQARVYSHGSPIVLNDGTLIIK